MTTSRMEAFSDGVMAIIITIMVLEVKVPHGSLFSDLKTAWPVLLSYVLSFLVIGVYWNNHHHLMAAVSKIDGASLWANLHLLFWLSLIPAATHWIGETKFASHPVAAYCFVLLLSGVGYFLLCLALIRADRTNTVLPAAIGKDLKGKASLALYTTAIFTAFASPTVALCLCGCVTLLWLIPDKRVERALGEAS